MNKSASLSSESSLLQLFLNFPQQLRSLSLSKPTYEGFVGVLGPEALLTLQESKVEEPIYSGYSPKLWLVGTPSEGALSYALWLMARHLYMAPDRADLSAWLEDSLSFSYEIISKVAYLKSRQNFDFVVQTDSSFVAGFYSAA